MKFSFKIAVYQLAGMVMLSSCGRDMVCGSKSPNPTCESYNNRIPICPEKPSGQLPGCVLERVCDGGAGSDAASGDDADGGSGCKETCVGTIVPCEGLAEEACHFARHCEWVPEQDQPF